MWDVGETVDEQIFPGGSDIVAQGGDDVGWLELRAKWHLWVWIDVAMNKSDGNYKFVMLLAKIKGNGFEK